ncbi:Transposase [Alicyclobacillus hesperidum]|uniref:Transposase n=2 Tax=Alicyclobacillus hesperidum TaxID=89784 RepID=A0A1H2Y3J4_9BACL|nr:IS21 family transposase [Alicyclobacillus hesperidum]SDW99650.1 Transposase [Alicyclobacillus hesperidum]
MLKGGSVLKLHTLHAQGKSIREIVRETGHARNTVRKYLRDGALPEPTPRSKRGSKLDPYKDLLRQWMQEEGLFNCEVMYRRLQELGYTGHVTVIKDFVRPFRPPQLPKAKVRYETKPGVQAQVDWGLCDYTDKYGQARKLAVFVMVLGYSRVMYVEFARRCDIHSFLRCFVHAIEFFGGIPNVALTDHMKTVVLGMNDDHTPQWHWLFEDFALAIGLTPKLCKVRRPQTKGKVERMVRYVKENFWPGRRFTDIADLNRQAVAWCQEVAQRIHGTTKQRPCDRLADEPLRPLPSPDQLEKFLRVERRVSADGYVSYDGVRYGVPWVYSRRVVNVRRVREKVEIWSEGVRIACHDASTCWGETVQLPGQYEGLASAGGYMRPRPMAYQIPMDTVEARPLDVYEALAEVATCLN